MDSYQTESKLSYIYDTNLKSTTHKAVIPWENSGTSVTTLYKYNNFLCAIFKWL